MSFFSSTTCRAMRSHSFFRSASSSGSLALYLACSTSWIWAGHNGGSPHQKVVSTVELSCRLGEPHAHLESKLHGVLEKAHCRIDVDACLHLAMLSAQAQRVLQVIESPLHILTRAV